MKESKKDQDHFFKSPQNIIVIYTSLSLILKMRKEPVDPEIHNLKNIPCHHWLDTFEF